MPCVYCTLDGAGGGRLATRLQQPGQRTSLLAVLCRDLRSECCPCVYGMQRQLALGALMSKSSKPLPMRRGHTVVLAMSTLMLQSAARLSSAMGVQWGLIVWQCTANHV